MQCNELCACVLLVVSYHMYTSITEQRFNESEANMRANIRLSMECVRDVCV